MGKVAYDYSMEQDHLLQDQAADKVQEMINELRKCIHRGGFDDQTVKTLVGKWTEAGEYAKGSGYWANTHMVWNMSYGAGHFHKKTSQELLDRLVTLELTLSKHEDIRARFYAFNAAEDAIRALVFEYRTRLKVRGRSTLNQFDGQLKLYLGGLNPNLYRQLGE